MGGVYIYSSTLCGLAALRFIYHIKEHSYDFSSYHCSYSTELKMQRWLYTAPVLIAILLWKPKGKSLADSAIKIFCSWLILQLYIMSGFMKKASIMVQNFFAWLPAISGSQACRALENPGRLPSKRVVAESPGSWLPASIKPGPKGLNPGGWGGPQREAFWARNWSFSLQDIPLRPCCAGFKGPAASQPHTSKLGK